MSEKKVQHDELDTVNEALSTTEQFVEKHQKTILTAVIVVLVAVSGFLSVKQFYTEPREEKALSEMFKGEYYFQVDSFQLALNGNGADYLGFIAIADQYGSTKAGNLATAYAGICYYNLGDYDTAMSYLSKFKMNDYFVAPNIVAMIGDCYVNQGKYKEAVSYFEKAAKSADNVATSPVFLKKAGLVYEKLGDSKSAVAVYEKIKNDYPTSADAVEIDKYIERAKK